MVKTLSKIVKAIPATESGGRVVCFTKPNCSGEEYLLEAVCGSNPYSITRVNRAYAHSCKRTMIGVYQTKESLVSKTGTMEVTNHKSGLILRVATEFLTGRYLVNISL